MKRNQWTQQLHDKLAEYETAAPDDLWADIEAALNQQPVSAQEPAYAQQPEVVAPRPRFVALRRWVVAASVATLLLGGGYLWWKAQPEAEERPELLAQQLPAPQGEGQGVRTDNYSGRAPEILSEEMIQTPPPTPPLEGWGAAEPGMVTPHTMMSKAGEVLDIAAADELLTIAKADDMATDEVVTTDETENIVTSQQPVVTEYTRRQMAELQPQQSAELSATKMKQQVRLGLYAMNGFDNQNSSNGVLMTDALAKQYMETYANSFSAGARADGPIYLSGYEERQHHHRPIAYGLTVDYPLSNRLSLNTGVVYTKLQSDFTQVMRSQQIQQEQTLHYVGISLGLSYRLWSYRNVRTYLSGGMKADWNVATHLETEGVSQDMSKDRMQWSFNVSMGVQYNILPQLGCYVEPSMNWYPDNGSKLQNYFKDKPLNLGLQIGLRLNLK